MLKRIGDVSQPVHVAKGLLLLYQLLLHGSNRDAFCRDAQCNVLSLSLCLLHVHTHSRHSPLSHCSCSLFNLHCFHSPNLILFLLLSILAYVQRLCFHFVEPDLISVFCYAHVYILRCVCMCIYVRVRVCLTWWLVRLDDIGRLKLYNFPTKTGSVVRDVRHYASVIERMVTDPEQMQKQKDKCHKTKHSDRHESHRVSIEGKPDYLAVSPRSEFEKEGRIRWIWIKFT